MSSENRVVPCGKTDRCKEGRNYGRTLRHDDANSLFSQFYVSVYKQVTVKPVSEARHSASNAHGGTNLYLVQAKLRRYLMKHTYGAVLGEWRCGAMNY